jgi:hypothetical protein
MSVYSTGKVDQRTQSPEPARQDAYNKGHATLGLSVHLPTGLIRQLRIAPPIC